MSIHDHLMSHGASDVLLAQLGEPEALELPGLGNSVDEPLRVDAIVGKLSARRETLEGGSHEEREQVEQVEVTLSTLPAGLDLSTPVVVVRYGEEPWSIVEIERDSQLPKLRLFRAYSMQRQRARLEGGRR